MHYVLNQTLDAADFRYHEWRVFRLDAKHHAHFQLHREAVFRDHLKRIEGVDDFARGPFNRLVRRGNYDRSDGECVDIVPTWTNAGFLVASITFRYHIGFMYPSIKPPVVPTPPPPSAFCPSPLH